MRNVYKNLKIKNSYVLTIIRLNRKNKSNYNEKLLCTYCSVCVDNSTNLYKIILNSSEFYTFLVLDMHHMYSYRVKHLNNTSY